MVKRARVVQTRHLPAQQNACESISSGLDEGDAWFESFVNCVENYERPGFRLSLIEGKAIMNSGDTRSRIRLSVLMDAMVRMQNRTRSEK